MILLENYLEKLGMGHELITKFEKMPINLPLKKANTY